MNWFTKLFGKKQEPKKEQKRNYLTSVSGVYLRDKSQRDNDDDLLNPTNILSPLNPLGPLSIWNNNDDDNISIRHSSPNDISSNDDSGSSYSSHDSSYSSYSDSSSSYDSSSSSSSDW